MRERRRVAAVIVRASRVLMVRQRRRGSTGRHDGLEYWVLPGGGIRPFEAPLTAARREVREEVGCEAERLVLRSVHANGSEGKRDTVFLFAGRASGALAATGAELAGAVGLAAAVLLTGVVATLVARRRNGPGGA